VRGVFQGFYVLVALSVVGLVLAFRRWRASEERAAWWRAVRRGAAGLAVAVAVLGVVSLVAFDAAFELFHRIFFAPGSYDFDPATSRLVQLFPDQFWSDTTLALGIVVPLASAAVAWLATRRLAAIAAGAASGSAPSPALQVGKAAP
jgi:integral membrane protein (TIGR01906 family)